MHPDPPDSYEVSTKRGGGHYSSQGYETVAAYTHKGALSKFCELHHYDKVQCDQECLVRNTRTGETLRLVIRPTSGFEIVEPD